MSFVIVLIGIVGIGLIGSGHVVAGVVVVGICLAMLAPRRTRCTPED